jgi:hypothetical protein
MRVSPHRKFSFLFKSGGGSEMTQTNPEQGRLYTRFITILKAIQYFGYFITATFSAIILLGTGFWPPGVTPLSIPLIFALLQLIIGCLIVYISTQSLIAIVDLLSRIELHTRAR